MNIRQLSLIKRLCILIAIASALLIFTTHSNTRAAAPLVIKFAGKIADQKMECGVVFKLGTNKTPTQVNDFRFYISNVRLIDANGKETAAPLIPDKLWQSKDAALLDFEDASAGCGDAGTQATNDSVTVEADPNATYSGIAFTLGIPFAANHQDTVSAPPPLNVAAMWWGWQYGYKFVRVDLLTKVNDKNAAWLIHLGSTGCVADNETAAPKDECANPNRVEIRLDKFDPKKNTVVADLATLLATVNLDENTLKPPGCMSEPDDPDCKALFTDGFALGLTDGQPIKDKLQTFFRVE